MQYGEKRSTLRKNIKIHKQNTIFSNTYPKLPKFYNTIHENWNVRHVNQEFQQTFQEPPLIPFRRNRNYQDLLGNKKIVNDQSSRNPNKQQNKSMSWKNGNFMLQPSRSNKIFQYQSYKHIQHVINSIAKANI